MPTTPEVLPAVTPSDLLDYVLTNQTYPTSLLVCQSRAKFINSLLLSIPPANVIEPGIPLSKSPIPSPLVDDPERGAPQSCPLLISTLDQVANSRHTNVAFTATLSHLRAYLAVFQPSGCTVPPVGNRACSEKKVPLLIVYGLLRLHRHTSEWSAQGIGSTLALLVELGCRVRRRIVLIEEWENTNNDNDSSIYTDLIGPNIKSLWEEKVPILSGTFIPTGIETEKLGPSGRTVEIGRILARWFKFTNQG